jgi:hypothetical protein
MVVRQVRAGEEIEVAGSLPQILTVQDTSYITTTIFVKYNYAAINGRNTLNSVTIAAVPNGLLQERYNPSPQDGIWLAGRNAPTLGEAFRVRLSFSRLRARAGWRVQKMPLPPHNFVWAD